MRPILREQGGHQRVDHRLREPVAHGEQEHAPEQALERRRLATRRVGRPCRQRQRRRDQVHQKRCTHQLPVSHPIRQHRPDHDDDSEAGQPASGDRAQLRLGESVLVRPLPENPRANRKTHSRGKNRHEPRPEQAGCVRSSDVSGFHGHPFANGHLDRRGKGRNNPRRSPSLIAPSSVDLAS